MNLVSETYCECTEFIRDRDTVNNLNIPDPFPGVGSISNVTIGTSEIFDSQIQAPEDISMH